MVKFKKLYMKTLKVTSLASWFFIFSTLLAWYCGEYKIMQNCELMCLMAVLSGLGVYVLTEVFEFFYKRL